SNIGPACRRPTSPRHDTTSSGNHKHQKPQTPETTSTRNNKRQGPSTMELAAHRTTASNAGRGGRRAPCRPRPRGRTARPRYGWVILETRHAAGRGAGGRLDRLTTTQRRILDLLNIDHAYPISSAENETRRPTGSSRIAKTHPRWKREVPRRLLDHRGRRP